MIYFILSLDTVGIAGYSHDFGTLHDNRDTLLKSFGDFNNLKPSVLLAITFMMAPVFPVLAFMMPTAYSNLVSALHAKMTQVCTEMMARAEQAARADYFR